MHPSHTQFEFDACDIAGDPVRGEMAACTVDDVVTRLKERGLFIISVGEKPLRESVAHEEDQIRLHEAARGVQREEVITFCEQLSVMIEAGVPLAEALEAFCGQGTVRKFKPVADAVRMDICQGETFSQAVSKWPRIFPSIMISLLRASETSGTMGVMLGRIAIYLRRDQRTRRQIKSALAYPLLMIGIGLLLTVFLVAYILPKFQAIYEARSADLPMPTEILLAVSTFLQTQFPIYGPCILFGGVGIAVSLRFRCGRCCIDWLRLHVPLIGPLYAKLYLTRSASTMATLFAAGVSLPDIIRIARSVTSNTFFDRMWDAMERDVRGGEVLSRSVAESPYVSASVASMIASGERAGELEIVMEKVASYSEDELEHSVKNLTTMLEPLMVIFLGLLVGSVALSLLLPIFRMSSMV